MTVPLVDLRAQPIRLQEEITNAMLKVLKSSQFINGPAVTDFETQLSMYVGSRYAIGCGSGTDALYLALKASGISVGDEVISTPFTFVATAEAIARCGATPVFVDIDLSTYNIDPSLVEEAITPKTKAILPIHMFGHPADMDPLMEIARNYGLIVIEDCAQSLGARYNGAPLGSMANVCCFSFFPSKVIGAAGDAGAITTHDPEIAEEIRLLRDHGAARKYYSERHGVNSRLDTIQAAIIRVKLQYIDDFIAQRNQVANWYGELLGNLPVKQPMVKEGCKHAFGYYTIEVENRASVQEGLAYHGIGNAVYYPVSLHLQPVFSDLGYSYGDFPRSEWAQDHVISLPMYPELTMDQIEEVVAGLKTSLS